MASPISLGLCFILGTIFLEQYFVQAVLPNSQDFPMGMGYDEAFNIKKVKPKKPARKTIGSYRLPKSVIPIHYDLQIRPILEGGFELELHTAPGKVAIRILATEATNSITLHSKKIWIDNHAVNVVGPPGEERLNVTGHNFDEERSFYIIYLDSDLKAGQEYVVTIPFRARIPPSTKLMAGLYRTSFMGSDGKKKTGVATQFEKDDASRAFPCFDEPHLKAEFTVKIGRLEKDYMSFCNMPRAGEPTPIQGLDGWVWDAYEKTLKIPTYLIGIAVFPDYVAVDTPRDLSRIPIRTLVPKAQKTNTSVEFAAAASGKIMTYFEELFEIPYYLSKMENLALPEIELLAMEHPGLVTYRTYLVVWHKGKDTQFELFNQAALIAHEFAHQWFGNLVTCNWWNDFWLNEAFARYYQYVGADFGGIDFRAKDRFVTDVVQWAMEFDEGPDTVSIRNYETDKVFYQPFHIEYEKGASIVRMMQTILTQDTFIKGIRKYFKRHAFGNAVQDDLYRALDEQAKEDRTLTKFTVSQVMKPWLMKAGYPVVHVTRGDKNNIFISQQRFIVHPAANDKIEPGLWFVPIWFLTKSQPKLDMDHSPPKYWLDKDTLTTYITLNRSDDWIIVNPEARGYYRVVYDRFMTSLISKQLKEDHTVFDFATRAQLFDDHFRCAHSRYISVNQAFDLTSYLTKEDDLIVWTTVFNNLRKFYERLTDTHIVKQFKAFIMSLINPPLKRLGTKLNSTATPSEIMLHAMFVDWNCVMEHPLCREMVRDYMTKWIEDNNPNVTCPVPADLKPIIYCAAVALMEDTNVEQFLIQLYKTNTDSRYRKAIVRALTCQKNEDALKRLVDNAINPHFPDIDTGLHGLLVLTSAMRNPIGRNMIWETIKNSSSLIAEALGPMAIPKVIESITPFLSNQGLSKLNYEMVDFIHKFMRTNNGTITPKAHDSLQKSAQRVVDNSLWMDYFYDDIELWFKENHHSVPEILIAK